MNKRLAGITICILTTIIVWGCDNSLNSIEDSPDQISTQEVQTSDSITFDPLPFNKYKDAFNPTRSDLKEAKTNSATEIPYGCTISTLNNPDRDYLYRYDVYELGFPDKIIEEAKGESQMNVLEIQQMWFV